MRAISKFLSSRRKKKNKKKTIMVSNNNVTSSDSNNNNTVQTKEKFNNNTTTSPSSRSSRSFRSSRASPGRSPPSTPSSLSGKKPSSSNKYGYRKHVNNNNSKNRNSSTPLPKQPQEEDNENLKFTADFLSVFNNTAIEYENLLDQLAQTPQDSPEYQDIIYKVNEFRTSLQDSARKLDYQLFHKNAYANKIINYLEILRTTFMKTCKTCKETTMTLQALLRYKDYEMTEFDTFIQGNYSGLSGISPKKKKRPTSPSSSSSSSRIMLSSARKRISSSNKYKNNNNGERNNTNNTPHDDLEDALLELLQEAGKIDPNIAVKDDDDNDGKKKIQDNIYLKPVESIGESRRKNKKPVVYSGLHEDIHNNNPPHPVSWEPVYAQLREAKAVIALQLEKSRSDLKRNVHPYFIRDLRRDVTVKCTAKELQDDGVFLLNEYNLEQLGEGLGLYERGRTFKAITKRSLVIEPFLDFVPRSEAMKNYVSALETIVYSKKDIDVENDLYNMHNAEIRQEVFGENNARQRSP